MNKKALILLADGFEEIEAITIIDCLRRVSIQITVCSLGDIVVSGSRNIKIQADMKLSEFKESFDALILPGGTRGAENLSKSGLVQELIKNSFKKNKIIAAICAAPALILSPLGILDNKKATCYPGMQNNFSAKTTYKEENVVVDANIITSRGPATAIEFSLKIIEILLGKKVALELKTKLLA